MPHLIVQQCIKNDAAAELWCNDRVFFPIPSWRQPTIV